MQHVETITIVPNIPKKLSNLMNIAKNLWWSWNIEAVHLFQDMDRELWEKFNHNPVCMLGKIEQSRLDELERDEIFIARMNEIYYELERYLKLDTWFKKKIGSQFDNNTIAYFSMEFGIHECLPIYSGGLGILAGDHMKSASDLGLPLIGIGLLYKHGYFKQYLNHDGWQLETYPANDLYNLPIELLRDKDGKEYILSVMIGDKEVFFRVWSIYVGRIEMLMLDTDILQNANEERQITAFLYGGDLENRLKQEILIGMGGVKVLEAFKKNTVVYHMNEGHSAFLAIERLIQLREKSGLSFEEARELVRSTSIFTTHTPVPAGIDYFPPDLMRKYFNKVVPRLGINMDAFLGLGRKKPFDNNEAFCMAILAINLSSQTNGVSKLHGEVSRRMFEDLWPSIPKNEVPITHITNGCHTMSWLSSEMSRLYLRYLGGRWIDDPTNHAIWKRIENIPPFELWRCRERLSEAFVSYARKRIKKQYESKGAPKYMIDQAEEALDPEVLTIGFARRFATYKRATLLFKDIDRLKRIITNPNGKVQFVFAGKAHPKDKYGKEFIQKIVQVTKIPELSKYIIFIENYDIDLARNLLQGVDVWLNNPRRPYEASGTSGMKASVNGTINLSVLDGWWDEGYKGDNGWAIGAGEEYTDEAYQDEVESRLLYEILENHVVPLFYTKGQNNIPHGWVDMMKRNIMSNCPVFNTSRMVEEYCKRFYIPCSTRYNHFNKNNFDDLKNYLTWKDKIKKIWHMVSIKNIDSKNNHIAKVGDRIPVKVTIDLAGLSPDEVRVEIFIGRIDERYELVEGHPLPLLPSETTSQGTIYSGTILCLSSGQIGYSVRCYPYNKNLNYHLEMGLINWWTT